MKTIDIKQLIIKPLIFGILMINLFSCSLGNENHATSQPTLSQMTSKVLPPQSINELASLVCGSDGVVSSINLKEVGGAPFTRSFIAGEKRAIKAYLTCDGGTSIPITTVAEWSTSNPAIFGVTNDSSGGISRGYITANSIGSAYLSVNYDRYEWQESIQIAAAPLTGITLSSSRADNTIAKGEIVTFDVYGSYSDGSTNAVSGATFSTDTPDVVSINGSQVRGLKEGNFNLTAQFNGYTAKLQGKVLAAQIKELVIVPDNITTFNVELPRTETVRAKLRLSDDSLIDIPEPSFSNLTTTSCTLFKLPTDKNTPFLNTSDNGCSITSTTESGINKLIYNYVFLKNDGSIDYNKPALESDVLIENSSKNITSLSIALESQPLAIVVGQPYRFKVYANLGNGESMDITKLINLNSYCEFRGTDCSNQLLFGRTGYIGIGSGQDDGKGGIVELVSSLTPDNSIPNDKIQLTITANLANFESKVEFSATMLPNVIKMSALSDYFVNKVYPQLTGSLGNWPYFAFTYVNANGIPIPEENFFHLEWLLYPPSSVLPLNDQDGSIQTLPITDTIKASTSTVIPRVNEVDEDKTITLASNFCNNTDYNQTVSSVSLSQQISLTTTTGRGYSITTGLGNETGVEFDVPFGKATTKISLKFESSTNENWATSSTTTDTITLPAQNIFVPAHGRGVVIQKLFSARVGGTQSFTVPLDQSSCFPFRYYLEMNNLEPDTDKIINTNNIRILNNLCYPVNKINFTSKMGGIEQLFASNSSMTFQATVAASGTNRSTGSSAAIYVLKPGDVGYDSISCGSSTLKSSAQLTGSKATLRKDKSGRMKLTNLHRQILPLSQKNLISIHTH